MEQARMTSSSGDSSTKRKAEEEDKEQHQKKSEPEDEERGVKRSMDEWESMGKKTNMTAEERSDESKNPGEGVDVNQVHVEKEIGPALVGESDVKFDEAVFELTDSPWRFEKCWEETERPGGSQASGCQQWRQGEAEASLQAVVREIKQSKREDLNAAPPPLET